MKAVILAAGEGSRMGGSIPKPLIKVAGREIMWRIMSLLSNYIEEFVVVVGRNSRMIEEFLRKSSFKHTVIKNESPERENGFSLYLAKDHVNGKFVVVMGDHVYDYEFIKKAVKGNGLIVDRGDRYIDETEVTKVKVKNSRIEDIGKHLKEYEYFDTGFFILHKDIFEHARKLVEKKDVVTLSDIVKEARIQITEVSGYFWSDVDTGEDIKRVRAELVRKAVKGHGDGFISRFINRKISIAISTALVEKTSPVFMTFISFVIGVISALLTLISMPAGAILYQISSILDGVDGEIARASLKQSKKGGYIDSLLDRFVDALFLVCTGVAVGLSPTMWTIAAFAIFGSTMISYSTERYKSAFSEDIYEKIHVLKYIPGKRDERIFVIMLMCIFGLIEELMWVIAIWSMLRVIIAASIVWVKEEKI